MLKHEQGLGVVSAPCSLATRRGGRGARRGEREAGRTAGGGELLAGGDVAEGGRGRDRESSGESEAEHEAVAKDGGRDKGEDEQREGRAAEKQRPQHCTVQRLTTPSWTYAIWLLHVKLVTSST